MSKNLKHKNLLKNKNAQSALREAEVRRKKKKDNEKMKEIDGREGPEPTRYNDWEKNGIISDF
tara:strand:- start:269 stop:457 length:189 start_codon:yes stop_codon:yes gene_type:complete